MGFPNIGATRGHPADPGLPHYVTARLLWHVMESRSPEQDGGGPEVGVGRPTGGLRAGPAHPGPTHAGRAGPRPRLHQHPSLGAHTPKLRVLPALFLGVSQACVCVLPHAGRCPASPRSTPCSMDTHLTSHRRWGTAPKLRVTPRGPLWPFSARPRRCRTLACPSVLCPLLPWGPFPYLPSHRARGF